MFISVLLVVGVTIVAATAFCVAKYVGIPIGKEKVSERLKNGDTFADTGFETYNLPETVHERQIRIIYVLSGEDISGIYLEILNYPRKQVHFLEIPRSTKVSVSDELYKELCTYSPTLPQYVKVSKLPSHFSSNFMFEGTTKVLSEMLGETVDCWITMEEKTFGLWCNKCITEGSRYSDEKLFEVFTTGIRDGKSNLDASESRMYYELYADCEFTDDGVISGEWDKTDYIIVTTKAMEEIEELKY